MFLVQIEVQATTRPSLPKEAAQEADTSDGSPGDAKVITDGNQAGSAEVHDVSPPSPSGNGSQDSKSGSHASAKAESTSGRQGNGGQASTSEDRSKSASTSEDRSKSGSKSGVIRSVDSKSSSGKPSGGTVGGRGTQEEYQEARLRFLSSGQGVLVSADSVSLDEGQVGNLVTASFDDL